jgi:hypothetical protein
MSSIEEIIDSSSPVVVTNRGKKEKEMDYQNE